MLPSPDLDDRRFQDLVDDAKRMVQARCPEWTDHNVSDPGVTLIETFAFMTDQLLYRLNRVPDRLYLAFLDLIGVTLHPATAATVDVVFRLSAPRPEPVVVPAGTEVSTVRTDQDEAVVFRTTATLTIPPRERTYLGTRGAKGEVRRRTDAVTSGERFPAFAETPAVGDVLLVGLDDAAPGCVVALRFDCDVQGVGVDPRRPPLVWEAWGGSRWERCDVDADGTGGLNRAGDVVLHVPATHATSVEDGLRAGWLRCRVVEPGEGARAYSAPPVVKDVVAFTVGGTVGAVHAETVTDEVLGTSEGVPGQAFPLAHRPVVVGADPLTLEVATAEGWQTWTETGSFAEAGPQDAVFVVDRTAGEVRLPPAVRDADGTLVLHGAVPPAGALLRVPRYQVGGGPAGNVAAGAIRVLRGTIGFVDRVENRRAGRGGVDAETVDEARVRGPLALRTRDRAVTAEDYEHLTRVAAPGLARVRCVAAPGVAEGVRVLVVPAAPADDDGRRRFEDLVPDPDLLARVVEHLEPRRTLGARVVVEPPRYQGVTVVARVSARSRARRATVEAAALRALYTYVDPLGGGRDGRGWPFGRAIHAGEVFAALQRVDGVETVEDVKLFAADPITGDRGDPVQRVEVEPEALAFSYQHQVRVVEGS
ncbi:putative baseplate assembly protein [Cellulosimicrobium protaetiae]|uniref:Putative baseplate assembly protein n=1 Tax=Cellulosimicrobium protaetiae TaxID=2587808 RepID=A0A6M5UDU7_9MICO|nr:putative baseplate assembly protein [Cellulosimicrobium protaetiae]QJW34869.1 putative baseplate assembly protein [Cellulosimicrobium protaetiae]